MGSIRTSSSYNTVMPELLVFKENTLLLVKGIEEKKQFWWPPGAYWISEKICNLENEEPEQWIKRTLQSQIKVGLVSSVLKKVDFISKDHSPVFIYFVNINGEPIPNSDQGFLEVGFFHKNSLPLALGRDNAHGLWLQKLVEEFWIES